jgi:2-octaprenyl-6-methoxyphenol hydroxylase
MSIEGVLPPQNDRDAPVVDIDVAIVGGGMVGASLALALEGSGLATMLIESVAPGSKAQPSFDERTTALGNASRRIFEALGLWNRIAPEAAAIRSIHVSEAGRFGFARLRADEQGIDAFGYVAPNRVIGAALWEGLQRCGDLRMRVPARPDCLKVTPEEVGFLLTDASGTERVRARLLVAADGAQSSVRAAACIEAVVEDYDQVAVVANVAADRAHDGTAYERFTPSGPLAVLPLRDGSYGVIWTCDPRRAAEVLSFDDSRFLLQLQQRFGWRAGRFVRTGSRASYPLKLTRAARTVGSRTVLIGNAAQALHPVAGQGFNLGLRDAAMLAETVVSACSAAGGRADPGDPALLQQFAHWRAGDRGGVVRFTDGLVRLFGSSSPGVGLLRNLGLLLFDLSPPAKSALARVSAGFAGPTPRLARGLRLRHTGGHA